MQVLTHESFNTGGGLFQTASNMYSSAKDYVAAKSENIKTGITRDAMTVGTIAAMSNGNVVDGFKGVIDYYKGGGAASGGSLVGVTVGVFGAAISLFACYLGLDMVIPMMEVNGTLPENIEKTYDLVTKTLFILGLGLFFVGLGFLVQVIRSWG